MCEEIAEISLLFLQQKGINNYKKIENKDSEGGTHYFLVNTMDEREILDASYKQFLYRHFVSNKTGEINLGSEEAVTEIDNGGLPDIFLGDREELKKIIIGTLNRFKINADQISKTLENWERRYYYEHPHNLGNSALKK